MPEVTILEPMSIGDVIDRAVRLYRKNFAAVLSIVAVPCLVGYVATLTFLYGYTHLLLGLADRPSPTALLSLVVGGLLYPVYTFLLLAVIAGLARVVGDHIMLGERISFRRWFDAAKKRVGSIALMWILMLGLGVVIYVLVAILVFVLIILAAVVAGITSAAGLPAWLITTLASIAILALVGAGIFAVLFVLARVVFVPQIVMIEGESAGAAIGRAIRLGGGGNWYKVGAIVLFTYFITFSIQLAMMIPLVLGLYLSGLMNQEFFLGPIWNAIYGAFGQISNILVLPIWIVALTLLYFDSRVRKEAYDVELLVREMNPVDPSSAAAFSTASVGSPAFAAPVMSPGPSPSPLSVFPGPELSNSAGLPQPVAAAFGLSFKGEAASQNSADPKPERRSNDTPYKSCERCGSQLEPQARFCHICGATAEGGAFDKSSTQGDGSETRDQMLDE